MDYSNPYSVTLASHSRGVHPGLRVGDMPKGDYLQKVLPEYMQIGYSNVESVPNIVQPYVDPNFGEPPKWTVQVEFKEWRQLPQHQKNLMIKEKLMNARNSDELNLIYNLRKNDVASASSQETPVTKIG